MLDLPLLAVEHTIGGESNGCVVSRMMVMAPDRVFSNELLGVADLDNVTSAPRTGRRLVWNHVAISTTALICIGISLMVLDGPRPVLPFPLSSAVVLRPEIEGLVDIPVKLTGAILTLVYMPVGQGPCVATLLASEALHLFVSEVRSRRSSLVPIRLTRIIVMKALAKSKKLFLN